MNVLKAIFVFCNNVRYLFRYDIKQIAKQSGCVSRDHLVSLMKYYARFECHNPSRIKIMGYGETIKAIIDTKASFCRFGDGEYSLMEGEGIAFQRADAELAKRLKEIILSQDERVLVGVNRIYFYLSAKDLNSFSVDWIERYLARNYAMIERYVIPDRQYASAEVTQLYQFLQEYNFGDYFERVRDVWRNRDVALICGEGVLDSLKYNIFDCAKTVEIQYAPNKNAFDKYEAILSSARLIPKDKLVIIILGPTATVLAYDLSLQGYQALDFGHIAKDYDAYVGRKSRCEANIVAFFSPD